MKKILSVFISVSFSFTSGCALFSPSDTFDEDAFPPTSSGAQVVTSKISSSFDDAEERANGDMWARNKDLELVRDGSNVQTVALRFKLDVPPSTEINEANIQFTVDKANSGDSKLTIKAEATDNSAPIVDQNKNVSSRARTKATVVWSPKNWTKPGDAGSDQKTPNLKSIVQEIIDRPNWKTGHYITFIITGSGTRTAKSYDGSPSGAASLTVSYSEIAPEPEPTPEPEVPELAFGYSGLDLDPQIRPIYNIGYRDGFLSIDTDKDGLPDSWEIAYGFDPADSSDASGDPDQDLLTAHEEFIAGTNPKDPDSDGDGIPDGFEVSYSLNPLDAADALSDLDGDGYSNLDEYLKGSDPSNPLIIPVVIPTSFVVNLSWQLPDTRTDGSEFNVKDVASFTIYYGTETSALDSSVVISDPNSRSYDLVLKDTGNYHFAMTITDTNGTESEPSAIGSINLVP